MDELISRIAKKLGENPKLMRKNLEKAQAFARTIDDITDGTVRLHETNCGKIFGIRVEYLDVGPVIIQFKNRVYPVVVPELLRDLGQKLLDSVLVTGLFRVPANTKRMEATIILSSYLTVSDKSAVENTVTTTWSGTFGRPGLPYRSGRAVADNVLTQFLNSEEPEPATRTIRQTGFPSVPLHVVATVLYLVSSHKARCKRLPSPLLPDFVTVYFMTIFEKLAEQKLSKDDALQFALLLGGYMPNRYKEVLAYLSYIFWRISQKSDKNGMTARNLAICCPNLFVGPLAQRCLNGKQVQAFVFLMEFFILNPHVFLSEEKSAVLKMNSDSACCLTLTRCSPIPAVDFPSPPKFHPGLEDRPFSSPYSSSSKRRQYFTPYHGKSFKGLNNLASDIKNRFRGGIVLSCLHTEDEASDAEVGGDTVYNGRYNQIPHIPPETEEAAASTVNSPEEVFALVTPPRDQFRNRRRSSTKVSVVSRRSMDDLEVPDNQDTYAPVNLDFEDVMEWLTPSSQTKNESLAPGSAANTEILGLTVTKRYAKPV